MSDYTTAELQALKKAYAAGMLSVTYDGRTVTYGNAADLLSRIREVERDMASAARPKAAVAGFSRGLFNT